MTSGLYSIAKHTLLPLIYTIKTQQALTYLLRDPATNSLLLLPSAAPRADLQHHIRNIEHEFKCKLTHTFANSIQQVENGPLFGEQLVTPKGQGELRPLLVGELSVCYIGAPGYRPDYNLVAVTHSSPTSTKFSVLFPGSMVSVCSIDWTQDVKASLYCSTLNKLKFFPNQTLIFPERKASIDDLQFVQALGANNAGSFLDDKIALLKSKGSTSEDCLIPTSMLQQKMMNPFLSPQKYASLLKTTDRVTCFEMLRRMRQQWKK